LEEVETKPAAEEFISAQVKQSTMFNQNSVLMSFRQDEEGCLEVPLIIADSREEELLLGDAEFQPLQGVKSFSVTEVNYSEKKSVLCYRLNNLHRNQTWHEYDQILLKVPIILVLFHRENADLLALIKQLEKRYDVPVYFLSSKSVAENVDVQDSKNINTIPQNHLILYDSLAKDKLQQIFLEAIDLYLNKQ